MLDSVAPQIWLVFKATQTKSSVMQISYNIFIIFLTFQKLKEVSACCDVLDDLDTQKVRGVAVFFPGPWLCNLFVKSNLPINSLKVN